MFIEFTDGRTVDGFPNSPEALQNLIGDLFAGNDNATLSFETLPDTYRTGDVRHIRIDR
jgi:hypothetical protein